ncbi:hypothetical protein MSG37_11310 [Shewanella sp. 1CM18E]|uniref:hypothetical protein n=1 Tax=Shewanella sp. 1CM18E TaxID=2929169 RepID=UPI0020BE3300|nr:hypothetical protein [Shewanella sp. 1CM18E]MCK8045474.1 hypothetical protein [Shewanella sp. 1CM18E]
MKALIACTLPLFITGCSIHSQENWPGIGETSREVGLISTGAGYMSNHDSYSNPKRHEYWGEEREYIQSVTNEKGEALVTHRMAGSVLVPPGKYIVAYWVSSACDTENCNEYRYNTVNVKAGECTIVTARRNTTIHTNNWVNCEDNWIRQPNGTVIKGEPICRERQTYYRGRDALNMHMKTYPLNKDNKTCHGLPIVAVQ